MADIAVTNVTFTEDTVGRDIVGTRRLRRFSYTVAFGNGALTYPAGGVPLSASGDTTAKNPAGTQIGRGCKSLGMPQLLLNLEIEDQSATGLIWKWDRANNKLRGYESDTTGATDKSLVELDSGSDAPAAQTLKVRVTGY